MKHIGPFKAQTNISFVVVFSSLVLMFAGCGRSREPSGKYVSVIPLPGSGEQWTETIEFKPNGICYYVIRQRSLSAMVAPRKYDHNLA